MIAVMKLHEYIEPQYTVILTYRAVNPCILLYFITPCPAKDLKYGLS